jgi:hypothetical protein
MDWRAVKTIRETIPSRRELRRMRQLMGEDITARYAAEIVETWRQIEAGMQELKVPNPDPRRVRYWHGRLELFLESVDHWKREFQFHNDQCERSHFT